MRGSQDLNRGHDITGCIYRKGWRVWLHSLSRGSVSGSFQTRFWWRKYWGNSLGVGALKERRGLHEWLCGVWWNHSFINFPPELTKLTAALWYATHCPHKRPYHTLTSPHREGSGAGQRTSAGKETPQTCCSISICTSDKVRTLLAKNLLSLEIQRMRHTPDTFLF